MKHLHFSAFLLLAFPLFIERCTSFHIAFIIMGLRDHPSAVRAILAAVLTFVFLYTLLTAWFMPKMKQHSILGRALRAGVIVRTIVSVISILTFLNRSEGGLFSLFSPDLWAGVLAIGIYGSAASALGFPTLNRGPSPSFLPIYSTTIIEGMILSITLFIISFFAVLVIQAKEGKKASQQMKW